MRTRQAAQAVLVYTGRGMAGNGPAEDTRQMHSIAAALSTAAMTCTLLSTVLSSCTKAINIPQVLLFVAFKCWKRSIQRSWHLIHGSRDKCRSTYCSSNETHLADVLLGVILPELLVLVVEAAEGEHD